MPGADSEFGNILRGNGDPVRFPEFRMDKGENLMME